MAHDAHRLLRRRLHRANVGGNGVVGRCNQRSRRGVDAHVRSGVSSSFARAFHRRWANRSQIEQALRSALVYGLEGDAAAASARHARLAARSSSRRWRHDDPAGELAASARGANSGILASLGFVTRLASLHHGLQALAIHRAAIGVHGGRVPVRDAADRGAIAGPACTLHGWTSESSPLRACDCVQSGSDDRRDRLDAPVLQT